MTAAENILWQSFLQEKTADRREHLVTSYTPLVRQIVRRFSQSTDDQEHVLDAGDLTQAGMMGLLDAIERFDPARGVKFETFAFTRIYGAIQDELRKIDWVPRSERKRLRTADEIFQHLNTSGGDEQEVQRFASERSLSTEDYYTLAGESTHDRTDPNTRPSQEALENMPGDGTESPFEQTQKDELYKRLYAAVTELPKRERLVVTLHYFEGIKFTAIAKVLKMSESRVSQIHASVIKQLRDVCADTM
jgi:RNA polymerase sigma factor for flagellar operon FliA